MIIRKKTTPNFSLDTGVTTALKFACSIIIVLHHYSQHIVSEFGNANVITTGLSSQGGYLAVSFFFFLSGYGLTVSLNKKQMTYVEYFKKRLSRVYMPAILVTIIWIMALNILHCETIEISHKNINIPPIFLGFLKSILLSFYDPVLWFVKIIILFYGLLFLYKKIKISNKLFEIIILLISILFCTIFVGYTIGAFASVSTPSFFIGVYTADNPNMSKKRYIQYVVIVLTMVLLSLLLVGDIVLSVHGLISIFMLLLMVCIFSYYNISISTPKVYGDISYDVYLVHNKVKILLIHYINDIPLSIFILFTTICAISFLWLRNKVMIGIKKQAKL